MEEKNIKTYEIGFLVKEENNADEIIKVINDYKANITNKSQVKKIQLAYPIKKETSAYFGYIHFSISPENIIKLNDSLKINSKILRFLITTPVITEVATLPRDRKSTRLNSSHIPLSRMPSSA